MSKLFILGSGFSKAVSEYMPTIKDLGRYIETIIDTLPGDSHQIYRRFLKDEDIEGLLTYLFQPMPWKLDEENYIDKANFIKVTKLITEYIAKQEEQAFKQEVPEWTRQFINYIHLNNLNVISLNYDTVLERLAKDLKSLENPTCNIFTSQLYSMPLNHLGQRTEMYWASSSYKTFRLLKLHGSINWYYSDDENSIGQQVFFIPVRTNSPLEDIEIDENIKKNMMDLSPLIIPPVTEKTFFYRNKLVKTSWNVFRNVIEEATEIYFIGYSIPKTDLTIRMFLSGHGCTKDKKVYIVNNVDGILADNLYENYKQIFTGCLIDKRYLGISNTVEIMVNDLIP